MIEQGLYREIPTSLELNGPILSFSSQPSSLTVDSGTSVTFTGIATATFPTGTPAENNGSVTYQWYDQIGRLSDTTRQNPDGTTTVISGTNTQTLSITNAQFDSENQKQYYLIVDYVPSAYGVGRSTPNSINEPLSSNIATLTLLSTLSITVQPTSINDGSTSIFSIFNVAAVSSNSSNNSTISYQWRLNGNNLSDNSNVIGSKTNQLRIRQPTGNYTIDCVVSHPSTSPTSITSRSVSYTTLLPTEIVVVEEVDTSNNQVSSSSANLNNGSLNVVGNPSQIGGFIPASTLKFLYAPERDLDVVIEMAAAGGRSIGGVQAGQGGWGVFRMTLRRNVEYSIKLGSSDGSFDPTGGRISGTPIRGGVGGGGAFFYEKGRLIAALGGGGGAGSAAAGGDGGGFNQAGQNGFGRSGGSGGNNQAPTGGGVDRYSVNVNGGVAGICPAGGDLSGSNYFRRIGLSDCQDYTTSGKFQSSITGQIYDQTASLNRGWKNGVGGRVNGGWAINGSGGAGGGGARGGNGSGGNSSGGGGGSGYADVGRIQVLNTLSGVNVGNAYINIKLYNPADPIPNPPVPTPPNYARIDWNDLRNPGYKRGPYEERNQSCTALGQCTSPEFGYIRCPGGFLPNPPNDYLPYFSSNLPNWPYFATSGTDTSGIGYLDFRIVLKSLGIRQDSDVFLINNTNSVRKKYVRIPNPVNMSQGFDPSLYGEGEFFGDGDLTAARSLGYNNGEIGFYLREEYGRRNFGYKKDGMRNFNDSPGQSGGFGQQDLDAARSQGFNDEEIRYYLENEYRGVIGPAVRSLLNDPNWGTREVRRVNGTTYRSTIPFRTRDYWENIGPSVTDLLLNTTQLTGVKTRDIFTNNKNEAFIPFSVRFRMTIQFDTGGQFRTISAENEYEWRSLTQTNDIIFTAEMFRVQNNIQGDGTSRLILPDSHSSNYSNPRITEFRALYIKDLDTNQINTLNMFAETRPV